MPALDPTASQVRLRFAPSPTGDPHIGNLRTAIVNWLVARHAGGTFIYRSEDTDPERSQPDFELAHMEAMRWLGLEWDEGPLKLGPFAPYRQSERTPVYAEAIAQLLAADRAYYCFCTESQLARERRSAQGRSVAYVYSRKCRKLSAAEAGARREAGEPATIRFDIQGYRGRIDDLIKGPHDYNGELLGDFVIARADGMPTYNLVCAVDDAAMQITHVLRGEDHLTNTPRQVAIMEALGLTPPQYGHLPLLLGDSGGKLSKREGAFSIGGFRRRGILPEAVFNYLATLGWSPADPAAGEVFTPAELIPLYELQRISRSAAHYTESKLEWFSAQHLRRATPAKVLTILREYAAASDDYPELPEALADPPGQAENLIAVLQPSFAQVPEALRDYLCVVQEPDVESEALAEALRLSPSHAVVLGAALEALPAAAGGDADQCRLALQTLQQELKAQGIGAREVYHALRLALTGAEQGPELRLVLSLLSEAQVRARLLRALRAGEAS